MKRNENYHKKYNAFYTSKQWQRLRQQKFQDANGLCERCLKKGIVRAGKEVHHIVPIDKDWEKRLDYDNLILLCNDCHNEMHERISPLQEFLKAWEEM